MTTETPDFAHLRRAFDHLKPGQQAELRRVAEPEELRDYATLYRLFPGQHIHAGHLRLTFLLPWCEHAENAQDFGKQCVAAGVNETRLLQMSRASDLNGLIQLRRIAMQIKPRVDWGVFGETLFRFWGATAKRRLVEQYFFAKFDHAKGGSK